MSRRKDKKQIIFKVNTPDKLALMQVCLPGLAEIKAVGVGLTPLDPIIAQSFYGKITFAVYVQYCQCFLDFMEKHDWHLDHAENVYSKKTWTVKLVSRITYDQFKKYYDQFKKYKDSLEEKKGNTNMKIIDETTNKDEEPESYSTGDVIAYWDKPDDKRYLMLTHDENTYYVGEDCQAISLKGSAVGSNDIDALNDFGYPSYTDIIHELRRCYDHVEKVKTVLHIVGRV